MSLTLFSQSNYLVLNLYIACKTGICPSAEENTTILSSLQLLLLEHSIMCHLIMGSKAQAIKEIAKVCRLLQHDSRLLQVGDSGGGSNLQTSEIN